MKVTISIPKKLEEELRRHIETRYGNAKARAMSLVIREAIGKYLKEFNHDRVL